MPRRYGHDGIVNMISRDKGHENTQSQVLGWIQDDDLLMFHEIVTWSQHILRLGHATATVTVHPPWAGCGTS